MRLGVLATCFQKRFAVQVNSDYHEPLSLHLVCGYESGGGKSPAFSKFFKPIREFEQRENERLAPAILEATRAKGLIEKQVAYLEGKLSTGKKDLSHEADLSSAFVDLDAIHVPVAPLLTQDDCTPESVAGHLAAQGGRMTIASSEGAFLAILAGRYSESPAIEICLKGHAGELLKIHRSNKEKPPIIINAPALSLVFCVQPCVLASFGNDSDRAGKGLLSRIAFVLPNSILGYRKHDQGPVNERVAADYFTHISRLLELPERRNPTTKEIEADFVSCAQAVRDTLPVLRRELEPELRLGGSLRDKSGYLSGFAGKAGGMAIRVAGLLALADERREITLEDFKQGKRFLHYAIGHAKIVSEFVSEAPVTADAKRVLAWIQRKGASTIKRSDVCKDLNFRTDEVVPVLKLLEDREYLNPVEQTIASKGKGRKHAPGATVFEVNPLWLKAG